MKRLKLSHKLKYYAVIFASVVVLVCAISLFSGLFANAELQFSATKENISKMLTSAKVKSEGVTETPNYGYVNFAGSEYWVVSSNLEQGDSEENSTVTLYAKKPYLYAPYNPDTFANKVYGESWINKYLNNEKNDPPSNSFTYEPYTTGSSQETEIKGVTVKKYDSTNSSNSFQNDFLVGRGVDWEVAKESTVSTFLPNNTDRETVKAKFFLPALASDTRSSDPKDTKAGVFASSMYEYPENETAKNTYFVPSVYVPNIEYESTTAYKSKFNSLLRTTDKMIDSEKKSTVWASHKETGSTTYNEVVNPDVAYMVTPAVNINSDNLMFISHRNISGENETLEYNTTTYDYDKAVADSTLVFTLEDTENNAIQTKAEVSDVKLIDKNLSFGLTGEIAGNEKIAVIIDDGTTTKMIKVEKDATSGKYTIENIGDQIDTTGKISLNVLAYLENTDGNYSASNPTSMKTDKMTVENYLIRYAKSLSKQEVTSSLCLNDLVLDIGPGTNKSVPSLTPNFSSTVTDYTTTVPAYNQAYGVDKLYFTATFDPEVSVTLYKYYEYKGGEYDPLDQLHKLCDMTSGQSTRGIIGEDLPDKDLTIVYTIRVCSGTSDTFYHIKVNVRSSFSYLDSLSTSIDGFPQFDKLTTYYEKEVESTVSEITFTAEFSGTAEHSGMANLYKNGKYVCDIVSSVPTSSVALDYGENHFTVNVTNSDSWDNKTSYDLYVYRKPLSPSITPKSGTYYVAQKIEITNPSSATNLVIRYTLDGQEPTMSSLAYTEPFYLGNSIGTDVVKAKIFAIDKSTQKVTTCSDTCTAEYVFEKIPTPEPDVSASGKFYDSFDLHLKYDDTNAIIRYTTDGTTPTQDSTQYTDKIFVEKTETDGVRDIKAKAYKTIDGVTYESDTMVASYKFGTLYAPVLTPAGGEQYGNVTVFADCKTEEAKLTYILAGGAEQDYDEQGIFIKSQVGEVKLTVKATVTDAIKAHEENTTEYYTFGIIQPVTSSLEGGTYYSSKTVKLSTETQEAEIYYSTDGTEPVVDDQHKYTGEFTIGETAGPVKLQAFSYKNGVESETLSFNYIFKDFPNVESSLKSGSYYANKTTELSCSDKTTNLDIYYRINYGKEEKYEYGSPINILKEDKSIVLTARAYSSADGTYGEESKFEYNFLDVASPYVSNGNVGGTYYKNEVKVELATDTKNATIYYTTNGDDPTNLKSAQVYNPSYGVVIQKNLGDKRLRAVAVINDGGDCFSKEQIDYNYKFGTIETPSSTLPTGEGIYYYTNQNTKLTCATEGVKYKYSFGDDNIWYDYDEQKGIDLDSSKVKIVLKFYAYIDDTETNKVSCTYNFKVIPTPSVSMEPTRTYDESQTVTLSSTLTGTEIRYTLDDTIKDEDIKNSGIVYAGENIFLSCKNSKITLRAVNILTENEQKYTSNVARWTYNFTTLSPPVADKSSGTYNEGIQVTLKSSSPGVTIRYTTDGNDPTEESTVYTQAISIPQQEQDYKVVLKAKAFKGDNISETSVYEYTIRNIRIGVVKCSLPEGEYHQDQKLVLTTDTSGTKIMYELTADGKMIASGEYRDIITLKTSDGSSQVLTAWAELDGVKGEVKSWKYTFKAISNPVSSLESGTYFNDAKTITLSCATIGANIYYTDDGTDITEDNYKTNAKLYNNSPISIKKEGTDTLPLKIRARTTDGAWSEMVSYSYTIAVLDPVTTSTGDPSGQTFYSDQNVVLNCATSEKTKSTIYIKYTLNGDDPKALGTSVKSGESIIIKKPSSIEKPVTLRAIATVTEDAKDFYSSTEIVYQYQFAELPLPTVSPEGGTYYTDCTVTLSCAEPKAQIYYSTDGTTPSKSDKYLYTGPFIIKKDTTLTEGVKLAFFSSYDGVSSAISTSNVYKFADLPKPKAIDETGADLEPEATYYASTKTITLDSQAENVEMYYTLDGTDPTTASTHYEEPFTIEKSENEIELKAINVVGEASSEITGYKLKFDTVAVAVSDKAGFEDGQTYYSSIEATLTSETLESQIRYTLDGSEPNQHSELYQNTPIKIEKNINSPTILRTKAYFKDGESLTKTYTYVFANLPNPAIIPGSGTYIGETKVDITCAVTESTIRYTLDGSDPTENSEIYSGTLTLKPSTEGTTVKAKAFYMDGQSEIVAEKYQFIFDHWEQLSNGDWCYIVAGERYKGFKYDIPGWESETFYFDNNGIMAKGWKSDITEDGALYCFLNNTPNGSRDGVMCKGWHNDIGPDGKYYFFDTTTGHAQFGWIHTCEGNASTDGLTYYINKNTSVESLVYGWKFIDGYWYYFRPDWGGAMATDTYIDGYYVDITGRMVT